MAASIVYILELLILTQRQQGQYKLYKHTALYVLFIELDLVPYKTMC